MPQTVLTLFNNSVDDIAICLSNDYLNLEIINEVGGKILLQLKSEEADDICESFEHKFCVSYISIIFHNYIISFDPLFVSREKIISEFAREIKNLESNKIGQRFQL